MSDSKKIILEESGKAFGQRMEHLVAMALEPSKLLRSQQETVPQLDVSLFFTLLSSGLLQELLCMFYIQGKQN